MPEMEMFWLSALRLYQPTFLTVCLKITFFLPDKGSKYRVPSTELVKAETLTPPCGETLNLSNTDMIAWSFWM